MSTTSAKEAVADIAKSFGCTFSDLVARTRGPAVDHARGEAYLHLSEALNWSLGRIGMFMGGKDRSTVKRVVDRARRRRQEAQFDDVALLRQRLNYIAGQSAVFGVSRAFDLKAQDSIVLSIFLRHRGKPLTLDALCELYDHAWQQINYQERFVTSDTIKSSISKLRKQIQEQGLPCPIETIAGFGYVMAEDFGVWCDHNMSAAA